MARKSAFAWVSALYIAFRMPHLHPTSSAAWFVHDESADGSATPVQQLPMPHEHLHPVSPGVHAYQSQSVHGADAMHSSGRQPSDPLRHAPVHCHCTQSRSLQGCVDLDGFNVRIMANKSTSDVERQEHQSHALYAGSRFPSRSAPRVFQAEVMDGYPLGSGASPQSFIEMWRPYDDICAMPGPVRPEVCNNAQMHSSNAPPRSEQYGNNFTGAPRTGQSTSRDHTV